MNNTQKTLALALSGAFALSISTASLATENPFSAKTLSSGYQVADAHKAADGKCGTGKCGAEKAKKAKMAADGKCGTGKCGAEKAKKAADGKCGAEKATDGKCGAEKATKLEYA